MRDELGERWGRVDGALHAIGFAPPSCLGGGFVDAPWEDVAVALQISAYSLKTLADVVVPHMAGGGSIVGLDFDNSTQAWPAYDWMGVAKAALESTSPLPRPRPRAAGHPGEPGRRRTRSRRWPPSRSPASSASRTCGTSAARSGWDVKADADSVARSCVALLSDWFPKTTGEIVHVDGGFHAVAA